MAQYGWTIDTLIDKLKIINELINKETDKEKLKLLKQDSEILFDFIDECENPIQEEKLSLLLEYKEIKNYLKSINYLWQTYQMFYKTIPSGIKVPNLKKCNLSADDLLMITHDFFKSQNEFFFQHFLKNFRIRNDHIVFNNNRSSIKGQTILLAGIQESYIEIQRDYTLEDILTVIHEYAHATSIIINPYNTDTNKYLYNEIETLFMELIAADYVEKMFKNNFSTIYSSENLNAYLYDAADIFAIINIINGEPKNRKGYSTNKELKLIAHEKYDYTSKEINNILNNFDFQSPVYLTSYLFAIELYETYQKDKDKALYYLKQIILLKDLKEKEYFYKIQKMGIMPNEHLKSYYNEVQEKALKLSRTK